MKYMKILIMIMVLSLSAQAGESLPGLINEEEVKEITCGEDYAIQDHMKMMGQLINDLTSLIDELLNDENGLVARPIITEKAQRLRIHMSSVFTKRPDKLYKIDPENVHRAQLIFQDYLLQVMSKTIEIEKELLVVYQDPFSIQAQKVKIANLIIEIHKLVEEAHQKFRQ